MNSNASAGDDHSNDTKNRPFGGRVKINVGGKLFEASLSTLTRFDDSMFSTLVASRWQGQDELFIDRNPKQFGKVLDYLRDGNHVVLPKDNYFLECLQREAEFYNLPDLAEICSSKLRANATEKPGNSSRVKINVGGTVFETSLSTLTKEKDSVFSAMLANPRQGQNELFFDRNPKLFPMVMDYLRDGMISAVPVDRDAQEKLRREAKFYNLPDLSKCVYKRGDRVQVASSAMEKYCLLNARKSYNGRTINQCKICGVTMNCGNQVYIGTKKDDVSVTYGVSLEETIPVNHKGGTVNWINSTCCDVFVAVYEAIHLPKTALRLSAFR